MPYCNFVAFFEVFTLLAGFCGCASVLVVTILSFTVDPLKIIWRMMIIIYFYFVNYTT